MIKYVGQYFYIAIFITFALEWIYLSVIRHAQGIKDNPLIKVDFEYKHPNIVGYIVELSRPRCHGLGGPGISSEEWYNRQRRHCVGIFWCPSYSLQINIQITSILNLISICWISLISSLYLFIGLVRFLSYSWPFFARLLCHHLFDNI